MIKRLVIIITVCLVVTMFGCFAPDDKLSVGDLTLVDSFYRMQREDLQLMLEDSCETFREQHLQHWIDSIKTQRQIEIQELIDSYGQ